MKTLVKMICLVTVLAWVQLASAAGASKPPQAQSSQKKPMSSNVVHDRTPVENRMEYNGNLTKKRNEIAKKHAPAK